MLLFLACVLKQCPSLYKPFHISGTVLSMCTKTMSINNTQAFLRTGTALSMCTKTMSINNTQAFLCTGTALSMYTKTNQNNFFIFYPFT